jgi:Peptidase family S41
MPLFRRIALIFALSVAMAAHAYEAAKWREDFAQARQELARSYANLDWVVAERKIDLQALVESTEQGLATAKDDEEAMKVLTQFLDTFGDGHVRLVPPQRTSAAAALATAATATATDMKTCRDMGYHPIRRDRAGIDFASTGQYEALTNEDAATLPAGVLKAGGRTLGVIRIGLFAEQAFPILCEREHPAPAACDSACEQKIFTSVGKALTRTLVRQVQVLAAKKIDAIVIDITGNRGGTDWAEAAARVLTKPGVVAPRISFIKHPHWVKGIDSRLNDIDLDLKRTTVGAAQRAWLLAARAELIKSRALAAEPCEREAIWKNQRVCPLLVPGRLHSTGLEARPRALDLDGYEAQWVHYNPARYESSSAWQGKLAILVDNNTVSAAELFAATLKDNDRATLIGAPTRGAGCGYTDGGISITLQHSGVQIKVPDCARLRASGENEVAGLVPDVLVPWRGNDSPYQRAARALAALESWTERLK